MRPSLAMKSKQNEIGHPRGFVGQNEDVCDYIPDGVLLMRESDTQSRQLDADAKATYHLRRRGVDALHGGVVVDGFGTHRGSGGRVGCGREKMKAAKEAGEGSRRGKMGCGGGGKLQSFWSESLKL